MFRTETSFVEASQKQMARGRRTQVTFAPQQGTSRTTPTSQSPPFHLMRGNRGHRLERKIAEAGPGLPGPLQVDTGLILGGTKNPMCLSRLKEKVGST